MRREGVCQDTSEAPDEAFWGRSSQLETQGPDNQKEPHGLILNLQMRKQPTTKTSTTKIP